MGREVIGLLNWDACEQCVHYPPEIGGCDVEGWDNIETKDDFVYCLSFEDVEDEDEKLEAHPDQLSFAEIE